MIEFWRRLFAKEDPVEDLISAYVDSEDGSDIPGVEERLRAAGVDVEELRVMRETSRMLRGLDTIEAPRSYALTPETLADRGYSEREIEGILDPRRRNGLRLSNATVFVPLAIGAVALVGVALITIGDITEYVTDRFDGAEESASEFRRGEAVVQTVVVEREVLVESEPASDEVEAMMAAAPAVVEVEKEVVVEVEKEVIVTVVVEKEVQVAGESVVQTVVVEREVVVEKEVQVTVVVEKVVEVVKEVEVEKVVEVEVVVERETGHDRSPREPAAEAADAAPKAMSDDHIEPTPTMAPCAVAPTPTPTPSDPSKVSTTPDPVATMSAIPTCTPTPTPTPSAEETATPSTSETVTPTPTLSPTPSR